LKKAVLFLGYLFCFAGMLLVINLNRKFWDYFAFIAVLLDLIAVFGVVVDLVRRMGHVCLSDICQQKAERLD
jgi:hypothetical protein